MYHIQIINAANVVESDHVYDTWEEVHDEFDHFRDFGCTGERLEITKQLQKG